jgi:transposase-like protein
MPKPAYRNESLSMPPNANGGMFLAALIAQEYRRQPTAEQLMDRFGMCRATAYRWRRAWREAAALIEAREGRSYARA